MREIMHTDFELRKIMTNGQRTEDQEIKTDTLVLGNANLEMRVKGEPHHFKDFVPDTLITVTFTQSQTTMTDFDKKQDEEEEKETAFLQYKAGAEDVTGDAEEEAVQRQSEEENEEEINIQANSDEALEGQYQLAQAKGDAATLKELEAEEELEGLDE